MSPVQIQWTVPQDVANYVIEVLRKRSMEECEQVVALLRQQMQQQLREAMRQRLGPQEEQPATDATKTAQVAVRDIQEATRQQTNGKDRKATS